MSDKSAAQFLERIVALRPTLERHAAFLIGGRTQLGSPEDFVQDTMVTALRIADRFEDDNLSGWLLAILHGHIRNARRSARVRTSVPLKLAGSEDDDAAARFDQAIAPSQEQKVEFDKVMAIIGTLSEADQEIIWLARIEGLSHDEISARLSLPISTSHKRLHSATARLRAAYEAEPVPLKQRNYPARHRAA
ncbi:RNA polymerase sigma factor [Rhodopseudomonas parapalustris]